MPSIPKPKKSKTKSLKDRCVALACKIATHEKTCISDQEPCHTGFMSRLIDPMHIVGRAQSASTAFRTDNILPGCRECHTHYTANPDEWKKFVDKIHPGRREMLEAVARSQVGVDTDWPAVYKGLQDEAKIAGVVK